MRQRAGRRRRLSHRRRAAVKPLFTEQRLGASRSHGSARPCYAVGLGRRARLHALDASREGGEVGRCACGLLTCHGVAGAVVDDQLGTGDGVRHRVLLAPARARADPRLRAGGGRPIQPLAARTPIGRFSRHARPGSGSARKRNPSQGNCSTRFAGGARCELGSSHAGPAPGGSPCQREATEHRRCRHRAARGREGSAGCVPAWDRSFAPEWALVIPRLAQSHRVVAPDLPGLGVGKASRQA
jgi:hypothetical protein